MPSLFLKVHQVEALTPRIRRLLLVGSQDRPLPVFTAGAHLELHVPGERLQRRAYSLVNLSGSDCYEIAVQLEEAGTGGSRWVHSLEPGDVLTAEVPQNHFPLCDSADHVLLIAGGIGITPMLGMARALQAEGKPFTLHYAGRDAAQMAYLEEARRYPDMHCWISGGDPQRRFPAARVLAHPRPGLHLYICGPAAMLSSVLACARECGWAEDHLHFELFNGALEAAGDQAFEVRLQATGVSLQVAAGQSVLDAMLAADLDPIFDCRRGDCGVCVAQVLEGDADHRDICLSARDRAAGSFCTCVSRASGPLLVLDL
ncbi:oxidoreductase [Pseudomonas putida]|uniref:PDR/VanB family oxidoreductase n=1 Tax=Pseudomonas TaxID=286 RepID=UPI00105A3126|nr:MULTISPECIES: PDR/VanB family oxidoreductase [Pseudomonas]MBF8748603.1 oxidoreductase [Pseudomonas monteilii]MCT8165182.1 PDR/VanB family oxidoreductase [Pseudomonas sp. HD6422]MCT8184151.1 PDR/VanB family oxidoreductase [Pseudomonas sp. HD6421]TDJ79123.1 oxidoreductase [Pseudomonas putida]